MIDLISAVIGTLETVEVHGKTNLDALLGCIQALERIVAQLEAPPEAGETEEVSNDG